MLKIFGVAYGKYIKMKILKNRINKDFPDFGANFHRPIKSLVNMIFCN